MKPTDRITQIAREIAKEDARLNNPNLNWEQLDDIAQLGLVTDFTVYLLRAILQYLDETASPKA